jgi:hypothetical protein
MTATPFLRALALALALVLAACGGGGGGIGGTGIDTGVAYGQITGFGSVWVNGVEYRTDGATLVLDGRSVTQADLRVGMVAQVQAELGSARATAVRVHSAIKGRVEAVAVDGSLTVMGQLVRVDADTAFSPGARPRVGDLVDVHGLPEAGGIVRTSFVQSRAAPDDPAFVVTGFVAGQDGTRLTVGALQVETGGADVGAMPGGSWVGRLVEVRGDACSGDPVCGTLTARKVAPGGPELDDAQEAELEGFVTQVGPNRFELGGVGVTWSAATRFENGTAADIATGVKLEAEGAVSAGVLAATTIVLRDDVRIEADVAAGDAAAGYSLAGLPGLSVRLDASTQVDNGAPRAGDHVTLRGRATAADTVIASRIERGSADPQVLLRAPVQALAPPTLTVLGVVVDTTGLDGDRVLEGLAVGDDVVVKGKRSGAGIRWEEIERDD